MKEITVQCISNGLCEKSIEEVSLLLGNLEKHELEFAPWLKFPYKPTVFFSIARDEYCIFLKYFVEEKYLRSENVITNGPVHQDSCVEFFISFDEGNNYYNIEFNYIGTGCIGYGSSKEDRTLLEVKLVDAVKKKSVIISESGNSNQWELTLAIPLSTFIYSPALNFKDIICEANFFKCGDLLPEPHFISWSDIVADEPNFHLTKFFGKLLFESG